MIKAFVIISHESDSFKYGSYGNIKGKIGQVPSNVQEKLERLNK